MNPKKNLDFFSESDNTRRQSFKVLTPRRSEVGGGGKGTFPPHYVIGSNFMRSCRILLKIELHTDQEHSYRFPECFCDSVIFGTPLAHFSSQGASKITKVTHTLSHYPDLRLHRQYTYSIAPYDSGWHYSAVQCQPASFQDISQRS